MTKIKDLATVTADNIVKLVPIDSERYELAVALGHWLRDSSDEEFIRTIPVFCNEYFTELFLAAQENVQRCAIAYQLDKSSYPSVASKIDQDRSRRYEASIGDLVDLTSRTGRCFHSLSIGKLVRTIWMVVLLRLKGDLRDVTNHCVH